MDTPKTASREIIRNIYLYMVSLIALVMIVFAAASLVNIALTTWVFPKANSAPLYVGPKPISAAPSPDDKRTPEQIAADNARAQTQYEEEKQNAETQRIAQKYKDIVHDISFLIVATPLFLYHWSVIRRDRKGM